MGRTPGTGSILVRAALAAAVVAGGVGWVATDAVVTLRVDGTVRTVHTHARDVAGVLRAAGVRAGARDDVVPALDRPVGHGDVVRLDRARLLTLTLDGRTRRVWVTAPTVADALADLRLRTDRLSLSASRSARLPRSGGALRVDTLKTVTLVADGRRVAASTFAARVDGLLAERRLRLDGDDRVHPARDAPLLDGGTVTVQRVAVRDAVETVTVPAPAQKRADPALMLDQQRVLAPGRAGSERQTVRYVSADGGRPVREIVGRTVLRAAVPRVVVAGSKPYPPDDTGLNWAALAACESGGNPRVVSSGGTYHGLYQFNVEMWQRMGGIGVPSAATPREQTYRAIRLYRAAGADQWPVCGSRLFS